jgi:hypothetical protein
VPWGVCLGGFASGGLPRGVFPRIFLGQWGFALIRGGLVVVCRGLSWFAVVTLSVLARSFSCRECHERIGVGFPCPALSRPGDDVQTRPGNGLLGWHPYFHMLLISEGIQVTSLRIRYMIYIVALLYLAAGSPSNISTLNSCRSEITLKPVIAFPPPHRQSRSHSSTPPPPPKDPGESNSRSSRRHRLVPTPAAVLHFNVCIPSSCSGGGQPDPTKRIPTRSQTIPLNLSTPRDRIGDSGDGRKTLARKQAFLHFFTSLPTPSAASPHISPSIAAGHPCHTHPPLNKLNSVVQG